MDLFSTSKAAFKRGNGRTKKVRSGQPQRLLRPISACLVAAPKALRQVAVAAPRAPAATTLKPMPRPPTMLTAAAEPEVTPAAARKSPTKIFPSKVSNTNRQLRLQSRPKNLLAPGDLRLAEAPVPELKDGQALARVKYLSIDPTMRVWMVADTYLPAVPIGE